MAGGKVRDRGTREAFWRGHVEACSASGGGIAAYCRERGLSEANFYYWRKRLGQAGGAASRREPAPSFVEVSMASQPAAAIELALAGGRRIQVHPGFDAQTLLRLVSALESMPC